MTEQLKLVLRTDGGSDTDSIDLLPYVAFSGWRQKVTAHEMPVDEALTLNVQGASDDSLSTFFQNLDRFIRSANRYQASQLELYGMWLRAQLAGETNARQTYVIDARHESFNPTGYFRDGHVVDNDSLGLKRIGQWEDTSLSTYSSVGLSALGGMAQLSASVGGDIDGRIYKTRFLDSGAASGVMNAVWFGLRSNRYGNPANFVPKWEVESGTNLNGAVDSTDKDATASPIGAGTNKSVKFPISSTLTLYWSRTLGSVSVANYTDQRGRFLVLARVCASDGSTTARLQMRSGVGSQAVWRTYPRVYVSGTNWYLYDLGQVNFPEAARTIFDTDAMGAQTLQLWAERLAGSGTLYVDCLVLIPVGEAFVYERNGTIDGSVTVETDIYQGPDGRNTALTFSPTTGNQTSNIDLSLVGGMPTGNVYGIIAAEYSVNGQDLTDEIDVELSVYKRYATLRGSA